MLFTFIVDIITDIISVGIYMATLVVVINAKISSTDVCDNLIPAIGRYIFHFSVDYLWGCPWCKSVNNRVYVD